jgi:ABC-type antimicrobial peptide transport system permease subunit
VYAAVEKVSVPCCSPRWESSASWLVPSLGSITSSRCGTVGADHRRVLRLVVPEAAWLVGMGVLIGIPGIYATSGLIRGALVGVSPSDPMTLLGVAVSLTLVTLATRYVAARRVLRIDPARLLQSG